MSADHLLSRFVDDWNAGRRPDADACIDRAPPGERAELAAQITAFLSLAREPDYDAATWATLRADPAVATIAAALAEPPPDASWATLLPRLRARAGLSLDALAVTLGERLGLAPGRAPKTARYLAEMERDQLVPERVSRPLLAALGAALGVAADALAAAGRRGPAAAGALYRRQEERAIEERFEIIAEALLADTGWDEVDELFQGGGRE